MPLPPNTPACFGFLNIDSCLVCSAVYGTKSSSFFLALETSQLLEAMQSAGMNIKDTIPAP